MKQQTQIKERPILFSAPMIRAILSGNKTQTRRVVKNIPTEAVRVEQVTDQSFVFENTPASAIERDEYGPFLKMWTHKCPYGQPGDILWVRETWKPRVFAGTPLGGYDYKADVPVGASKEYGLERNLSTGTKEHWKSPIHMPKEAARIWLRVKDRRVERLQDISEADAKAEGMTGDCQVGYIPAYQKAPLSYHFATVWEDINGAGSWSENPFVWVVEYEVLSTTGKPKN